MRTGLSLITDACAHVEVHLQDIRQADALPHLACTIFASWDPKLRIRLATIGIQAIGSDTVAAARAARATDTENICKKDGGSPGDIARDRKTDCRCT